MDSNSNPQTAYLRQQLQAAQSTLRSVVDEYTTLEQEAKEKEQRLDQLRRALGESPVLLGCSQALWEALSSLCASGGSQQPVPVAAQRAMAACLASSERLQQQLGAASEPQLAAACTLARAPALLAAAGLPEGGSLRSEERGVLTAALGEVREHARRLEGALAQAQGAQAAAARAAEAAGVELARAEARHASEMERLGARLAAAAAPATVLLVDGEAIDSARVAALRAEAGGSEARARAAERALDATQGELQALRTAASAASRAGSGALAAENAALRERAREAEARERGTAAHLAACKVHLQQLLAAADAPGSGGGGGGGGSGSASPAALLAQLRSQLAEEVALREAATASADAARLQLGESEARLAALSASKADLALRAAKAVRDVQKQAESLAALSLSLRPRAEEGGAAGGSAE